MIRALLGVWDMKTKKLHKDKVNIITLGCSKNMVDSEVLSGQLLANEIDVVHENKKSDHNIMIPLAVLMYYIYLIGNQLPAEYFTIHHVLTAAQCNDVHFVFM